MSDHLQEFDEAIREASIRATNAFLKTHLRNWPADGSRFDLEALHVRPHTDDPTRARVHLRCRGNKVRELTCKIGLADALEAAIAELEPRGAIFNQAEILLLIASAAHWLRHPVQVHYSPFHEQYRAHPDGRIEIVDESISKRDAHSPSPK